MATKAAKETKDSAALSTEKVNTALTVTSNIADLAEADAGTLDNGMTMADTQIPYMLILQSLSPQVTKSSPNRVDGAEEGDLYNSGNDEIYDGREGITVIPCAFRRANVEWVPREKGGGFVQTHDSDAIFNHCSRNEKGVDVRNDNGNHVVPTYYYYCIAIDDDEGTREPIVISMSRTAMSSGRKWNNLIQSLRIKGKNGMFNPPMFMSMYKFATEPKSNQHGSWYVPRITSAGLIQDADLYNMAKTFHEQVMAGTVRAMDPQQETTAGDFSTVDLEDSPM